LWMPLNHRIRSHFPLPSDTETAHAQVLLVFSPPLRRMVRGRFPRVFRRDSDCCSPVSSAPLSREASFRFVSNGLSRILLHEGSRSCIHRFFFSKGMVWVPFMFSFFPSRSFSPRRFFFPLCPYPNAFFPPSPQLLPCGLFLTRLGKI